MIKGRLIELLGEMGLRPLGKRPKLAELVEWVIAELPVLRPDDPRAGEALRIANYCWYHERSSK